MKNLLYIDRTFKNEIGGDKNRSRFLHDSLQKNSNVFTCTVKDEHEYIDNHSKFVLSTSKQNNAFLPNAIAGFSEETKDDFVSLIQKFEITELFFRTIAFSLLAVYAKKKIPTLNIIIDADLILSRLMEQAWRKNRSFKSRYYLLESLKLSFYEKNLYKNDFTFLFSSEDECIKVAHEYSYVQARYLPNTSDLKPNNPSSANTKTILFYGSMESTANIDGYKYIHDKLFDEIKDELKSNDYKIQIVGRGCDAITPSQHERIEIIGEVESIETAILESSFVILPIFIASGTNTRVLETAMAGRALITTELGMEGLSSTKNEEIVSMNLKDMAIKIKRLMSDEQHCIYVAKILQEKLVNSFSYENFQSSLNEIIEETSANKNLKVA